MIQYADDIVLYLARDKIREVIIMIGQLQSF